jgi:Zn-dependent peptidase ImmA (M78 family)
LNPAKALLLLSFRYLTDDQFWFTVFHELGHLLLHGTERIFLEGLALPEGEAEVQANSFAASELLTPRGLEALRTLPLTVEHIVRFARSLQISPGVVVGQLQYCGRVSPAHFNGLKRHYRWDSRSAGPAIRESGRI